MIEQLLRSKREELVRKWEDREKRLEAVRLKEKAREERVRKRRRIDDHASSQRDVDDEEAEWLLDDPADRGIDSQNPLSGLSKESREVLTKIGLGGWKSSQAAEEEELLEEEVKVRMSLIAPPGSCSNINRYTTPQEHIPNCHNSSLSCAGLLFLLRYPTLPLMEKRRPQKPLNSYHSRLDRSSALTPPCLGLAQSKLSTTDARSCSSRSRPRNARMCLEKSCSHKLTSSAIRP